MPLLQVRVVKLQPPIIKIRPIIAETGPIGTSTRHETVIIEGAGDFAKSHQLFIEQIATFNRCFKASEIVGFLPEELYDHLLVSLQDNAIIQDGDRFFSRQAAYEMKTKMQGYTYRSGIKPQTYGFAPVL